MISSEEYDVVIIGAGMSGLAAGIRLAMYDKKVCILEKHSIPGGLNSYYQRGKRQFDVGLHAMTNFVEKGTKQKPLTKLLKQLRMPYEVFDLSPQKNSRIVFPHFDLTFNNDPDYLFNEIREKFPKETQGLRKLLALIDEHNETALDNTYKSAKEVVRQYIKDELLLEMIFCPLLIYGSAQADDMDFSQFVIMFKSIFLEGLARPKNGVRTIIGALMDRAKEVELPIHFKTSVESIVAFNGQVSEIHTEKGEIIKTKKILSSVGYPETLSLVDKETKASPRIGQMSFTETILVTQKTPTQYGLDDTLIFYNGRPQYHYRKPESLIDPKSAVICMSNNFTETTMSEGMFRLTNIANFEKWNDLSKSTYKEEKQKVEVAAIEILQNFIPSFQKKDILFRDIFTPKTITRYTSHFKGCVYGTQDKVKDGRTEVEGLYLCGTDQGFLGIVGAMLSGISMANLHGLMGDQ